MFLRKYLNTMMALLVLTLFFNLPNLTFPYQDALAFMLLGKYLVIMGLLVKASFKILT